MLENMSPGFWTMSDTNQAVQPQNMARVLKFYIWKEEGLFYLCSENKGPDQLRSYYKSICVFVFAFVKSRFSRDMAYLDVNRKQKYTCLVLRKNDCQDFQSGTTQTHLKVAISASLMHFCL